jgi:hypothetical protein
VRRPAARDQPESAFAAILASLVRRTPGARAAALVDFEGETVDYAGRADPYSLKVAAAHWKLVMDITRARPGMGALLWLSARCQRASYVARLLPEGYAVLLVFAAAAGLPTALRRSFDSCVLELAREAGWRCPPPPWIAVEVVSDRRRPTFLRAGGALEPIEIIGVLLQGLGRRERGWRVRCASGVEATLIREPGDLWYVDDLAAITPAIDRRDPPALRGILATFKGSNKNV